MPGKVAACSLSMEKRLKALLFGGTFCEEGYNHASKSVPTFHRSVAVNLAKREHHGTCEIFGTVASVKFPKPGLLQGSDGISERSAHRSLHKLALLAGGSLARHFGRPINRILSASSVVLAIAA